MTDERELAVTPSQTVGPFFHIGLSADDTALPVRPFPAADRIRLHIVVTDGDGRPVPDAVVEVWQAVADGDTAAFGRLPTGPDGSCEFETVRPPRHVNVCLFARGLLRHICTRIYFADDPALATDPVLTLVPQHRRQTLVAAADPQQRGRWRFDLRLQGSDETVFFEEA